MEASELDLVTGAMAESPGGLLVVGIHAPLFNLWNDEYLYFLRETQRPQQQTGAPTTRSTRSPGRPHHSQPRFNLAHRVADYVRIGSTSASMLGLAI